MDSKYSQEELDFQKGVARFFESELPEELRIKLNKGLPVFKEDQILFQKALAKKGWAAVNWPAEYGGTGWSAIQKAIFFDELARHDAPRLIPFGYSMVAPVIYTFGSEEQKRRFLPDILQSNVWWCQGYSEPGAGSDLASLKMSAVRGENHFIVNGQKTWTTLAQHADWIFCLVRTDPHVKKQMGISFLLIDMQSPGVEVRPIKMMDGMSSINEVYFENVKVPFENLIGEENKGWTYAKYLLTHERTGIGGVAFSKRSIEKIKELAAKTPAGGATLMQDPAFLKKLAEVEIELTALEYTDMRILSEVSTGSAPGPESSIIKIKGTEIQQKLAELRMEMAAYSGFIFHDPQNDANEEPLDLKTHQHSSTAQLYFGMRKTSIYGGSNEIQKGIIAKAVLGL
ncbi:MAG: acyl-CoA dehydrogenase family protein [SAR324 cluster bacterium]|nr:acyl-CoA dehydrogenase family protein [SAR324 cluster bacterium]